MVSLYRRALIILDMRLAGCAVNTGSVVFGIAHPRAGPLGVDRIQRRACFGIQQTADLAHPVGFLLADDQVTAASPIDV